MVVGRAACTASLAWVSRVSRMSDDTNLSVNYVGCVRVDCNESVGRNREVY